MINENSSYFDTPLNLKPVFVLLFVFALLNLNGLTDYMPTTDKKQA